MKGIFVTLSVAILLGVCGCTNIESTQKFNGVTLGIGGDEKAICVTHVTMSGLFFFGLPICVGSTAGNGKCTWFRYNLTAPNAIYLLTKEVRDRGAVKLTNVNVSSQLSFIDPIGMFTWSTIQSSGVGVRSRSAAITQATQSFDNEP